MALYPSLDIDKVIETVWEMIRKSEIVLEGVNFEELRLVYLAIVKDNGELTKAGIEDLCPKRKQKMDRKPMMTGRAANSMTER